MSVRRNLNLDNIRFVQCGIQRTDCEFISRSALKTVNRDLALYRSDLAVNRMLTFNNMVFGYGYIVCCADSNHSRRTGLAVQFCTNQYRCFIIVRCYIFRSENTNLFQTQEICGLSQRAETYITARCIIYEIELLAVNTSRNIVQYGLPCLIISFVAIRRSIIAYLEYITTGRGIAPKNIDSKQGVFIA